MMIASPMDASGFASLVEHFRDRTVVTYDPCGVGRSQRTDGASWPTPEQHADDLHRLISALGGGLVHIFASSGGAVNGLALVAGTRIRCGRWWRTSRRPPRPCRAACRRWRRQQRRTDPLVGILLDEVTSIRHSRHHGIGEGGPGQAVHSPVMRHQRRIPKIQRLQQALGPSGQVTPLRSWHGCARPTSAGGPFGGSPAEWFSWTIGSRPG
jgi:hypothetical protein